MEAVRTPLKERDLNQPTQDSVTQILKTNDSKQNKVLPDENPLKKNGHDVQYFRNLLTEYHKVLTDLCLLWDQYEHNPDEDNVDQVMGDIRTTIGQARLVMKERFSQFEGLVDNCEFDTSEKPVTCEDLQGFWDMIFFQVEDVQGKFKELDERKQNHWKVIAPPVKDEPMQKKKKIIKKKPMTAATQAAHDRRAEARKRLAAAKAAMKKENVFPLSFDAGFFKVDSPVKAAVERPRECLSASRKRPASATPSSANFLHGRFLKKISDNAMDLKKTLNFEEVSNDAKIAGDDDNDVTKNVPDITSTCDSAVVEDSAQQPMRAAQSTASQTDPYDDLNMEIALEKIVEQLNALRDMQQSRTKSSQVEKNECAVIATKELAEEERECVSTGSEQENNVICHVKAEGPLVEVAYKAHYERLLEKVQVLEAELAAFENIKLALAKKVSKWKDTFTLIDTKSKQMETFFIGVKGREQAVQRKEEQGNEELVRLRFTVEEYQSKINLLEKRTTEMDEMAAKIKLITESNDHQSKDILELQALCDTLRKHRDCLKETVTTETTARRALEESFNNLSEQREFEQNEFANEKTYLEEHLAKLESALEATKNHMLKLQEENVSLSSENKQVKAENSSLQEECDIVKTTSRLDILEQQQEVNNCEQKIREVTSLLSDFSDRLLQIGQDKGSAPNPVEIALKTPSKSLVVSALLADSKQIESPQFPDDNKKPHESLYRLATELETLVKQVIKTSRGIACEYEEKLQEYNVVNETLMCKINELDKGSHEQSTLKREVELMLRRQLVEVTAQRDKRTEELQAEQHTTKILSERLDRLMEKTRQL